MTINENTDTIEGWGDTNELGSNGEKKTVINFLHTDYHKTDDYGSNWSSFTTSDLPSSPTDGKTCSRTNTNATGGSMRSFKYDGNASTWRYFDWNDGSVGTV